MLVLKNPWSDKADALIGPLMCSDGGTKHGRDVTLCFTAQFAQKSQKISSTNVKEMEKEQPNFNLVFIASPQ